MYNLYNMDTIIIHHIRPGKKEQIFHEGLVSDDEHGLSTITSLSEDDSKSLPKDFDLVILLNQMRQ